MILEATNAASFTNWISSFNLSPPATAPSSDPDGDRLNNAEEFLFARNPTLAEATPAFSIIPTAGGFNLRYSQRKALPPTTYYVIEETPSLSTPAWQPAPGVEFIGVGEIAEALLMTAFVPVSGANQGFYRFRIVLGQ